MTTRVCASILVEETTREIERTWHSSRPKPRARAMGLKSEPRPGSRRAMAMELKAKLGEKAAFLPWW